MAISFNQWPFETPVYQLTLSQLVVLGHVRAEMNNPTQNEIVLGPDEIKHFSAPSP